MEDTAKPSMRDELPAFPHHQKNVTKLILKPMKTHIPSVGRTNPGKYTVLYASGKCFAYISKPNSTLSLIDS